jgi:hypothetical protein
LPKTPRAPSEATSAALAYINASRADKALFLFIIQVVLRGDYTTYIAKHALDGRELEHKQPDDLARTEAGPLTKRLREHRQALLEMFVSRQVDNFQKYLVDLIREILRSKPSMLSTGQQLLTFEELLKYERIEDLVHYVIEGKVNALSYQGFVDLQKWCTERGIQIRVSASRRPAVVELIATRNIIAHNRGLIDEGYIRAVRASKFQIGVCRVER